MLKFRKKVYNDDEPNFQSKKIKDDLLDIYDNALEEEKVDMAKLEKNSKGRIKMFFTTFFSCSFLIFLFFVIGWVISNRQSPPQKNIPKTKSIVLSVDYPQSVYSGEKIIYKIKYKNIDKVKMTKMQLLLNYPEGFIYESSSVKPDNSYNNIFTLSDIDPFAEEELDIVGRLVGKEGVNKSLLVSLSYEPANFSSEFQEVTTTATKISSAAIVIGISGDYSIIPNKDSQYSFEITNKSQENIDKLRLIAIYPEKFIVKKFNKDPVKNIKIANLDFGVKYNVWNIAKLKSNEKEEFKINGVFSGEINDDQIIIARVEISNNKDEYNLIAEKSITVKAIEKEVALNLMLNGENDLKSVSLGNNLGYSIIYENKGENDLKDVKVKAYLQGYQGGKEINLINWSSLNDENNGLVRNNVIIWTSDEILKLSSFSAQEEGTIDFFINLLSTADVLKNIDSNIGDLKLKSWIEMDIGKIGDADAGLVVKSNEITVDINTDLIFDAQARYFNDDNIAVGSGPLPPKVGEDTKYRIFWTIKNSLHKVKDITVKAILPKNVSWSGKINKNIGEVGFNKGSREIVWKISSLPVNIKKSEFDFEVGIKPTLEDRNKILILLGETTFSGIDSKTNGEIKNSHKALITDLKDDPITSGRGLVE